MQQLKRSLQTHTLGCSLNIWLAEPTRLRFYNGFVDNIINKRYKDLIDNFFQALNSNHPMIKYTIEVNPDKFLNSKVIQRNGIITTEVNRKYRKLPARWTSRIPKRYNRNLIISDLNRALWIFSLLMDESLRSDRNFWMQFIHSDLSIVS